MQTRESVEQEAQIHVKPADWISAKADGPRGSGTHALYAQSNQKTGDQILSARSIEGSVKLTHGFSGENLRDTKETPSYT
jgi:hypothetical protein